MKRFLTFFALIFVAVSITGSFAFIIHKAPQPFRQKSGILSAVHYSRQDDPAFYTQAYSLGKQYTKAVTGRVAGGIVPHHLLAAPLIAGFFEGIADQNVATVILIGPNHFEKGPYAVTTSQAEWKTVYGELQTDSKKIDQLVSEQSVQIHEALFDNEHAVYGIAPFIKRTFPNARFVPLVLKSSVTKEACDRLISSLSKIVDSETLVIASVDFSHYLPSVEADKYDAESIAAITSLNAKKVLQLDSRKNFDSPGSLYTLLRLMDEQRAVEPLLLANLNSAKLTNQAALQSTTSYVTVYFTDQILFTSHR